MKMVDKYSYSVTWSPDDEVFVAWVAEFPSLAAHGDTHDEALAEIKAVVAAVVDDLQANGEHVPEPFSLRSFSGKLVLRMPKSLHRDLVFEAEREGVSLNQLITSKLSRAS
jgi:predicted HicB family RNase H-like nuclease